MVPLIGRNGAIQWCAGEGLGDDSFVDGFVDRIVDAADNFVDFLTLRAEHRRVCAAAAGRPHGRPRRRTFSSSPTISPVVEEDGGG